MLSFDSDRSSNGGLIGASGSEVIGYKSQPPNNTIMILGLAQHFTEADVSRYFFSNSCNQPTLLFTDQTRYHTVWTYAERH